MKIFALSGCLLLLATSAAAQGSAGPGARVDNSVGNWGQPPSGGTIPCLVAPAPSGSSNCGLPVIILGGGGGGGGGPATLAAGSVASGAYLAGAIFDLGTGSSPAANTTNNYLQTVATAQGAQGTGSTYNPPAGGSGIIGYLSGIFKAITGTLNVQGGVSNASDGVAPTSTNVPVTSYENGWNGVGWDRLQVDGLKNLETTINTVLANAYADGALVQIGLTGASAYAGSGSAGLIAINKGIYNAAIAPLAAQSAHGINTGGVEGIDNDNASITAYPLGVSGRAQNAEPTAATNGQNARIATDLVHRIINYPFANKENEVTSGALVITASTASTSAIAAPGANLFIYVTDIECFNSGSTSTTVLVQNGSGGATIWEGYVAASGGAFTKTFATPIGGVNHMTANTAVFVQGGSSTSSLICNLNGFKGS